MQCPNERHQVFMRGVVALARQCQLDNLEIKFQDNFEAQRENGFGLSPRLAGRWHEGRHGEPSSIQIEFVCSYGVAEKC